MSVVRQTVRSLMQVTRRLVAQPPPIQDDGVAQAGARPNFIVVITDDMRDSDWQALPQTRALVGKPGTTFPNFVLTTPVCSPSRTSLLTGKYAHNHRVIHNNGGKGGFAQFKQRDLGDVSIAATLRAVGYRTGIFGKFLNGGESKGPIPGGWDQWMVGTGRSYYHTEMNENGKPRILKQRSQYETDVLADRARDFVKKTPPGTPFLLWFTPRAPHGKLQPRRKDRGRYSGVRRQRSPDVQEVDRSDKPANIRRLKGMSLPTLDSMERKRLDMLVATDEAVASILETVKAEGRLENTIIFVLSDNGYMLGSHGCPAKGFPYRESIQVTMLASGPPFAAGGVDRRVAGNIDLAPTIAALAGVSFPGADGVPIFERTRDTELLIENFGGRKGYSGLRSADWLYVENSSRERELYDYRHDPYELDNLLASWEGHAPDAAASAIGAEKAARLQALRACSGGGCR